MLKLDRKNTLSSGNIRLETIRERKDELEDRSDGFSSDSPSEKSEKQEEENTVTIKGGQSDGFSDSDDSDLNQSVDSKIKSKAKVISRMSKEVSTLVNLGKESVKDEMLEFIKMWANSVKLNEKVLKELVEFVRSQKGSMGPMSMKKSVSKMGQPIIDCKFEVIQTYMQHKSN